MKTKELISPALVLIFLSGFLSCTKTNNVLIPRKTITLYATQDASIFSADTTGNHDGVPPTLRDNGSGAGDILRLGYTDDNSYFARTLIAFDLSTLPATATIDNVTLSLNIARIGREVSNNPVSVHKLMQGWTEGTNDDALSCCCSYGYAYCQSAGISLSSGSDVTWNSTSFGGPAWTTPGGTFVSTPSATIANPGTFIVSSEGLIDDVKAWRTVPASNFGWILKVDEDNVQKNGGEFIRLYSRNASTSKSGRYINGSSTVAGADPSTKPTLTILYH